MIARAASSVCRKAATVEMSGSGAPLRTPTPIEVVPSALALPAAIVPLRSRLRSTGAETMTTSVGVPATKARRTFPTCPNVTCT